MSAEAVQVDPPVPEEGRGPTVRRLGWGVADQAVSSASNFLLGVFIAKSLGVASLGAFGLAYVTYSVILNGSRGLSTDPLIVRFSGPPDSGWRRAVSAASGTALVIGVLSGVVCAAGGILLWAFAAPPVVGLAFITLAVGLPGLLVQDSWRFAFFSSGQGAKAFANDVVWTVLMVGALAIAWAAERATVELSLLIFGGTASLAAVVGLAQSRIMPRPERTRSWLSDNRHLGPRYLVENVSNSGASQLRAFVLGAVAGLVAVGQVRGAEMLIGPFLVILFGVAQVAVPEARRTMRRGSGRLLRFCMLLAAALAMTSVVWGLAILVLLPLGLGEAILGSVWEPAYGLAPGVIVTATAACLSVGAASGLRALGQARRSLRAQLTATSLYLVAGCGGAIVWGAKGAVWGAAVAGLLGAAGWWVHLHRGLREGPLDTRPRLGEQDPASGQPEAAPSSQRAPRLTIGLPTYNGERYLTESLDCLLDQTFDDFELLISDNASTDGTAAICERYEALDPRVRYIRQSRNIGSAANHNFVVDHAHGELFKWASDDDLYHRDLLRRCVDLLDADDGVVVTHSLDAFIDEAGRVIQNNPYELDTRSNSPVKRFRSLLYGRGGNDIYGVMRTDVMRRTHGHGSYHNADRTLVAELALHGRFDHVPDVLYYRRDHPGRAERASGETRARAANLDPRRLSQSKLRLLFAYVGGYLGAIQTAPLGAWQKAGCGVQLAGYVASRLIPLHQLGAMQSNDPAVRERASHSRIVRLRTQMLGRAAPAEQKPICSPRERPALGGPVHEEATR